MKKWEKTFQVKVASKQVYVHEGQNYSLERNEIDECFQAKILYSKL